MIYTDKIHLVADSVKELHEFAQRMKLEGKYWADLPYPHYDLNGPEIALVLKNGAKVLRPKQIFEISKKMKNENIAGNSNEK